MTADDEKQRRTKGDHTVFFNKSRGTWVAQADLGFTPQGKRIRPKASGKTEEAALRALRKKIRPLCRRERRSPPAPMCISAGGRGAG